MEKSKTHEEQEDKFNLLLIEISEKMNRQQKHMFQVLLRNTLSTLSEVEGAKSVRDLLFLLKREGHLSYKDPQILLECIKMTDLCDLVNIINKYFSCQNIKNLPIKLFPKVRRGIMAFAKALSKEEIEKLEYFYFYGKKQSHDVWHLVMRVENKMDISHDKAQMHTFLSNLRKMEIRRPVMAMEKYLNDEKPAEMPSKTKTETHRRKKMFKPQEEISGVFPKRKSDQLQRSCMVLRSNCNQDNRPDNPCKKMKPKYSGRENIPVLT